jgi:3-oxoacyl-[acyl-carrier-protein] synthase II
MPSMSRDNPVVITGAGMVSALGQTPSEVWDNLVAGKGGIRPIERFDARGFACRQAAQVHDLEVREVSSLAKSRIADVHTNMLLKCSRDAFREAHLEAPTLPRDRIGFFLGMGVVDCKPDTLSPAVLVSRDRPGAIDMARFFARGWQQIFPFFTLSVLNNISLCVAAIELEIHGENTVFAPHADAGVQALVEALHTLLEGRAMVALSGGVSETLSAMSLARGHLTEALNLSDGMGANPCRPFGADRAGAVLGEACAISCLESRATADHRGLSYRTALTGYGQAFGADENADGATAESIARAMTLALERADLKPDDIEVLIAHGDGSQGGDQNEIAAIDNVFGRSAGKLFVYSSKAALGHTLAAAPAVDLVIGALILEKQLIPPTLPFGGAVDQLPFRLVVGRPQSAPSKRVMINCRSSQGQTASLILEKLV